MNTYAETNHAGYITSKESGNFAYELLDGKITIHALSRINEIEEQNYFVTEGFDNKKYLMYSQIPISLSKDCIYPQNYSHEIDWIIKRYQLNSKFYKVEFDFPELRYFCPSTSIIKATNDSIVLPKKQNIVKEFDIDIQNIPCHVAFVISCTVRGESAGGMHTETISKIHIDFPETNDYSFIEMIYHMVDSVFAFLCNRRNTGCTSMELFGNYECKTIKNREIIDTKKTFNCTMFFFNKYREEQEEQKNIAKAFHSAIILPYIDKLFILVAKDLLGSVDDSPYISISSIHPSFKRRNLIDLQQSLHITGAFEFYVRRYLPKMVEEKSHHTILKMLLSEFADKTTGKTKKLAKSLANNVIRELSLQEKIEKVYGGYGEWNNVKNCIEEEWFSNDISGLAKSANEWRNELAHEKRSYTPNFETIRAIRFVEHLNYIILLRFLGCTDLEIKEFLTYVLIR